MKAEELRIGNLVLYQGDPKIIVGITEEHPYIDDITFDYLDWDEIKPIPLTEEWLLNLGFTTDPKHHVLCYDLGLLSIELPNKFHSSGRAYFNSWAILNEMPKHVHQLQNLYFALTGQELVIKDGI